MSIDLKQLEKTLEKIKTQSRTEYKIRDNFTDYELTNLYKAWNILDADDKTALEDNISYGEKPTTALVNINDMSYIGIERYPDKQQNFAFEKLLPMLKKSNLIESFIRTIRDKIPVKTTLEFDGSYPDLSHDASEKSPLTILITQLQTKLPEYFSSSPISFILYSLFAIFLNILNILFDIRETRKVWLKKEYRWNSEFAIKIANVFKLIRELIKFLYHWIPASDTLKKSIILFLIFYYPPGRWMFSIICQFLLCFTGIDIQLKLLQLKEALIDAGWKITDFVCAINMAIENFNKYAPVIGDVIPALNQLTATGEQLALTGQHVAETGGQLTLTIKAAQGEVITGLLQFKSELVPLLTAAGVSATCSIPRELTNYLQMQGDNIITNVETLSEQIQQLTSRIQNLDETSIVTLQQISDKVNLLGLEDESTFNSLMDVLGDLVNKAAFKTLLNSEQVLQLFTGRPRIGRGGLKRTRKHKKHVKGSKTRKTNKGKRTHKRYRRKAKRARKSKKY